MEPFKNLININTAKSISSLLEKEIKDFDSTKFLKNISSEIDSLELKERVRLISKNIYDCTVESYPKILKSFEKIIDDHKGFSLWPISQFIEEYGIQEHSHLPITFKTLGFLTTKFTAEFAIRPYINKYEIQTYKQLNIWAKSSDEHHRRLASEGCRPNLPWGGKLVNINNLLAKNLDILETLKFDDSEYVRKSVSNHLNDISRVDQKFFLKTIKEWHKQKVNKKLIRHSLRTLLKAGNEKALDLLGYKKNANIKANITSLSPKKISEDEKLTIKFSLHNNEKKNQPILLDLVILYPMKNGKYSKKIFRIKDTTLKPNDTIYLEKLYHFKKVTTRKHYPGDHFIKLQINGNEFDEVKFKLI